MCIKWISEICKKIVKPPVAMPVIMILPGTTLPAKKRKYVTIVLLKCAMSAQENKNGRKGSLRYAFTWGTLQSWQICHLFRCHTQHIRRHIVRGSSWRGGCDTTGCARA